MTYNKHYTNTLHAGGGLDCFWATDTQATEITGVNHSAVMPDSKAPSSFDDEARRP